MFTYTAEFGPNEHLNMIALLAMLLDKGFGFEVVDDRGGSGTWKVRLKSSASIMILPNTVNWNVVSHNV